MVGQGEMAAVTSRTANTAEALSEPKPLMTKGTEMPLASGYGPPTEIREAARPRSCAKPDVKVATAMLALRYHKAIVRLESATEPATVKEDSDTLTAEALSGAADGPTTDASAEATAERSAADADAIPPSDRSA